MSVVPSNLSAPQISSSGRYIVLIVAFMGWAFAGVHMSIVSIVMRVASQDLLQEHFVSLGIDDTASDTKTDAAQLKDYDADNDGQLDVPERKRAREGILGQWFGWLVCAFLFGAASGGYLFGIIGDRIGRAKAMAASIACYSLFSAATYVVNSPEMLLLLRFLTCMGIGGMWPNGIALIAEAWPNVSRPILAGVMGTSANVGILCFAIATTFRFVTADDWRWTMLVGAAPVVLAVLSYFFVPESPRWLALRSGKTTSDEPPKAGLAEIFKPPIARLTAFGILLGTIPLFGGWGVGNWAQAWASEVGDTKKAVAPESGSQTPDDQEPAITKKPDPALKSKGTIARSLTGSITSLLGGALAAFIGRKLSYGLLCTGALVCTQFLFRIDDPSSKVPFFELNFGFVQWGPSEFVFWMAALGFFSGFFFGWLPLCLPELFPTRVRSTGAGVSFNWGRILTGIGVLVSAALLKAQFQGQYAEVGKITGFVYAIGIVVILFAPVSSGRDLDD